MVFNNARDKAVPAVLVAEVFGGGRRVAGSGGGGQDSLGGWGAVNSCLHTHVKLAHPHQRNPIVCVSCLRLTSMA